MGKLSIKETEFIQNYLKNSGIEFIDIRYEVTDHVASALEAELNKNPEIGFYSTFKNYMVQHKKHLIANANKYRWSVDKKVLKEVCKNLIDPRVLILSVSMAILLFAIDFEVYLSPTQISIGLYVFLFGLSFIPLILYRKLKLSFLNRIGALSTFPFLITHNLILTETVSFPNYKITYAILYWVLISFSYTSYRFAAEYKRKIQFS